LCAPGTNIKNLATSLIKVCEFDFFGLSDVNFDLPRKGRRENLYVSIGNTLPTDLTNLMHKSLIAQTTPTKRTWHHCINEISKKNKRIISKADGKTKIGRPLQPASATCMSLMIPFDFDSI